MNKRKINPPARPAAAPDRDARPRERRTLHVRFGGAPSEGDDRPR